MPCVGRRPAGCKPLSPGKKKVIVPGEEAPANSVPAAAVIRRVQALRGITGRKEFVGGKLSLVLKALAQPMYGIGYWLARVSERKAEFQE